MKVFKNQYPDINIILGQGKTIGNKYIPAYYNHYKNEMVIDVEGVKQMWKDGRPFKINTINGEKLYLLKKVTSEILMNG